MKALIIWAFVAGFFNGVLMRIWDFIQEQGGRGAGQPLHT